MSNIVFVGNYTKVLKVVVGTPVRTAVIATDANIDEIVGVDTTGAQNGAILVYNDSSDIWEAVNNYSFEDSVIDGKVYPGNINRQKILIRRSGTQGTPSSLRTGEIAYSWLADPGTNGFGNGGDRLYIGIGAQTDSSAARIDTIGGRYFTNLLNHQHGILTASSAAIVDSNKRINQWFVTSLQADSAVFGNISATGGIITTSRLSVLDSAFIQNLTVIDSVSLFAASIQNLLVTSSATFITPTSFKDVLINSDLTVSGFTTLDSTSIVGSLIVYGDTTLDSAYINKLSASTLLVNSTSRFNAGATFNNEIFGTSATFADSVAANSLQSLTFTDGFLTIRSGIINNVSSLVADSVTVNVLNITNITATTLSDGFLSIAAGSIDSAINGTFSGTLTASSGIFDSVTTNILTVLDSATIGTDLSVGALLTATNLSVSSTSTFNDSVNVNGNVRVDGNTYITNGTLYINNVSLNEIIDSDVNQLLEEGEAIDISYSDSANSITISAEIATFTNLGVASFGAWADSAQTIRQFSVTSGAIRVEAIDGGFFAYDSTLPG
jgi:hypothetical protein